MNNRYFAQNIHLKIKSTFQTKIVDSAIHLVSSNFICVMLISWSRVSLLTSTKPEEGWSLKVKSNRQTKPRPVTFNAKLKTRMKLTLETSWQYWQYQLSQSKGNE